MFGLGLETWNFMYFCCILQLSIIYKQIKRGHLEKISGYKSQDWKGTLPLRNGSEITQEKLIFSPKQDCLEIKGQKVVLILKVFFL